MEAGHMVTGAMGVVNIQNLVLGRAEGVVISLLDHCIIWTKKINLGWG